MPPAVPPPPVPPPPVPPPPPVDDPPCAPTLAVTVAVIVVWSRDVAMPVASVVPIVGVMVPAVVEKATGALASALPLMSETAAEIVDVPPAAAINVGFALTTTRPTAAVPTAILTALLPEADAAPDVAVMTAVPFAFPALNVTTARPLISVSASGG